MRIVVVHPTRDGKWKVSRWTPRKNAVESQRYRKWWMKRGRFVQMMNPEFWS